MPTNTEKIYTTWLQTRLTEAITDGDVTCVVEDDLTQGAPSWATGKAFYMTFVDPSANREIVKVTGISGKMLTIARGQDGSTARAWETGTLMEQRLVAADAGSFIQPAAFREIGYTPNGVLTANYPGEKVYQTDAGDCKKRWWKNVTSNLWQLIAGEICEGEVIDTDPESPTYGYIIKDWEAYFDNTKWYASGSCGWGAGCGIWDDPVWEAIFRIGGWRLCIRDQGTWTDGYRPTKMRVTFTGPATLWHEFHDTNDHNITTSGQIASGEEISIWNWGSHDIGYLYLLDLDDYFEVTNIEFRE